MSILLLTTDVSALRVESGDEPQVSIVVDSARQVYSHLFDAEVTVEFYDLSLINAQLYLSYQIPDEENNILLEESNRQLLIFDESGRCQVKINVAPATYGVTDLERYTVRFDIADTLNLFWFGRSETHRLYSDQIQYSYNPFLQFLDGITDAVKRNPVAAAANVIFFGAVIVAVILVNRAVKNQQSPNDARKGACKDIKKESEDEDKYEEKRYCDPWRQRICP